MAKFNLDEWSNVGNLLLRRGAITQLQLERALKEQSDRKAVKLGELLIELKICSPEDIEAALHEQRMHRLPVPSQETEAGTSRMRAAFARVERETNRLTERRRKSTIELEISPLKV